MGVRAWESMAAGNTFDLEGPDAQAVSMPPAPRLESSELIAEMTELYWMALCRDIHFSTFADARLVHMAAKSLRCTRWIRCFDVCSGSVSVSERGRGRDVDRRNVFRGVLVGDDVGPYVSQFLLVGTEGLGGGHRIEDGLILYGGIRIDQRVRVAAERDYMTSWEAFVDVQNGADVRGRERYVEEGRLYRFISTPRDLATYVHYDALYQAYLNACIILLGLKVPFDKGIPFQLPDHVDKQQGFATFGPPHILTLVTEVATRALKAVRFQKYNVHRRLRPEAVGGLVERYRCDPGNALWKGVRKLYEGLDKNMLARVIEHNEEMNKLSDAPANIPRANDYNPSGRKDSLLLPMAFAEGSPMHPCYGAGHATVAGACTTILKAFFDHRYKLPFCFVPDEGGCHLVREEGCVLTVEGELNKVCSNISIGRNWAGVHYFSDYRESIVLGEKIALGILEEQRLTYREKFSMTVPTFFDGDKKI